MNVRTDLSPGMSGLCRTALCMALIGLGVTTAPTAQGSEVSGHVKSFNIASEADAGLQTTYLSQNSLRVKWETLGNVAAWQFHYELSPTFASRASFAPDVSGSGGSHYRLSDPPSRLGSDTTKHPVFGNLDRLNLQLRFDHGDVTIGRQAITLGSSRIINPTDVFVPFNVQTFNTEYRNGIDAVRYQRPLGMVGELDLGMVMGNDMNSETSALFLQVRINHGEKDLQFAAIQFANQTLTGFGVQSALGEFGFWLEAASVTGDQDYVRVSTGLDLALSELTIAQIEYHFNGAGTDEPLDYLINRSGRAYQSGGVFLLGKHYLMPSLSHQISPLLGISVLGIFNLTDGSTFLAMSGEFNAGRNVYLDLGLYQFTGSGPVPGAGGISLGSEYGASPNVVYGALRYYF